MANEIKHYSFGTIASPIAPVAGTYTLTFGGSTTAANQWDDDETAVQAALEALASIGSGNVSVTSDFNNGFYVEFNGDLADFNIEPLTANSSLKQAASTVTVTETQTGQSGVSTQIFDCSLDDAPTEGKFVLSESTNGDTAASRLTRPAARSVESAIDAVVGYSVTGLAGGPWTCESDAQEAYSWSGAEDPGAPLRKALDIEVATDQEGDNDWEGSGALSPPVSELAGAGTISSTGTGAVDFASALAGDGNTPYQGSGAIAFAVSALASDGIVPYTGSGGVELVVAAIDGEGLIDSTGTGDLALQVSGLAASGSLLVVAVGEVNAEFALAGRAELADTGRGFRHFEHMSNIERVLVL